MSTRDYGELAELLAAQKDAYALLLSLSLGQAKVFAASGARGLMKVIARKEGVIGAIDSLHAKLRPYASSWDETMSALPEPARREVAAAVTDIASMVKRIIESEKAIECIVAAARDKTAAGISGIAAGRSAVKAYGGGRLQHAGRILDREG